MDRRVTARINPVWNSRTACSFPVLVLNSLPNSLSPFRSPFRERPRMVHNSAVLNRSLLFFFPPTNTPGVPAATLSRFLRRSYGGILIRVAPLYRNYHFYPSSYPPLYSSHRNSLKSREYSRVTRGTFLPARKTSTVKGGEKFTKKGKETGSRGSETTVKDGEG